MTVAIGILSLTIIGAVYAGQVVSVVNLGVAQRLGLQEKPEETDPLFTRLEVWTARWDLMSMWVLPIALVLMLIDHRWWPYAALIGGSIWVDTGGREGAKWLGLREQGVRLGSRRERRLYIGGLVSMVVLGGLAIVIGLVEVV